MILYLISLDFMLRLFYKTLSLTMSLSINI